jgi:hypothetical protein
VSSASIVHHPGTPSTRKAGDSRSTRARLGTTAHPWESRALEAWNESNLSRLANDMVLRCDGGDPSSSSGSVGQVSGASSLGAVNVCRAAEAKLVRSGSVGIGRAPEDREGSAGSSLAADSDAPPPPAPTSSEICSLLAPSMDMVRSAI